MVRDGPPSKVQALDDKVGVILRDLVEAICRRGLCWGGRGRRRWGRRLFPWPSKKYLFCLDSGKQRGPKKSKTNKKGN